MIHNSEQTRKLMDNIKKANIKFKVDTDIERRLLKENATENAKDLYYIGNVSVFIEDTIKGGYFHINLESKSGKLLRLKYGANNIDNETFLKVLQFLSENN